MSICGRNERYNKTLNMILQRTLIDNSTDELKMAHILNLCIQTDGCNEIMIATGFWDLPGTNLLQEQLTAFLQRGGKLKLLIGKEPSVKGGQYQNPNEELLEKKKDILGKLIEHGIKEEYHASVKMLMGYTQADFDNSPIQIKIYNADQDGDGANDFMHAKCYIFRNAEHPSNYQTYGIVGSSNFTKMGLEGNAELNYLENDTHVINWNGDGVKGHVQWFTHLWNQANPWNEEFILEGLEKVREKLPEKVELEEQSEENPLTPYESYIHLLNDRFGALADSDIKAVLRSYLPADIMPMEYQLDAAALCYQIMHQHGGFLLGDVVGLGKTIVGVMVLKYYIEMAEQEGRSKKCLIVTPPAIKSNWQRTINQFDAESNDKIQPYVEFITTGSVEKLLDDSSEEEESTGEFDSELRQETYGLILVDESHNFRNNSTHMYEMLDTLIEETGLQSGNYPYIGLLSATLQNNRPEDLKNQIYLFQRKPRESTLAVEGHNLDFFFQQACNRYAELMKWHPTGDQEKEQKKASLIYLSKDIRDKVLSELLVRRTRTDIKLGYHENLHFPEIKGPNDLIYHMDKRLSLLFYRSMDYIIPTETAILNQEPGIVYMRYRATEYLRSEMKQRYTGRNMTPEKSASHLARIMQMLLVKRLESSFSAFRESLANLQRYTQNMITMWEADSIFICPLIDVNKELDLVEKKKKDASYTLERCFDDIRAKIKKLDKEGRNSKKQNAEYHCSDFDRSYIDFLREDKKYIDELVNDWDMEHRDPKLERFIKALDEELFLPERNPSGKLVIFSEAIATVKEIAAAIGSSKRVLCITAANRDEKEQTIRENFDANYKGEWKNDYDVIVTTEVLAEGINLHRANAILNYDTPWNSTKLIQRIGRVNRIGSEANEVWVYNFYPSDEGDQQIDLKQRAFTKLQSFHTLFGEDSKVFTIEEEVSHPDYKKLVDGPETPFTKFITELQNYKKQNPERFEWIKQQESPVVSAFRGDTADNLFVVKTEGNDAGSIYVRVAEGEGTIIPCLEMLEACQCQPQTPMEEILPDEDIDKVALNTYNMYIARIFRSAQNTNKSISKAREAIRKWIALPGLSAEAKQRLSIASRIIGKGDIAIAKKVIKMAERIADPQQDLFNFNIEDVNQIVSSELAALNQRMIDRYGEPYIYLHTNKVNN